MDDRRGLTQLLGALLIAGVTATSGCRIVAPPSTGGVVAASRPWIAEQLYFGRKIPAGGMVSDAEWSEFLRSVVTPRFPKGFAVWQSSGQWLDPRGDLVREPGFVLEVVHERSEDAGAAIEAIADEYKKRFGQDAVLRVTNAVDVRFY